MSIRSLYEMEAIRDGIGLAKEHKELISEVVSDPLALRILSMTISKNLSVQDIAANLEVSVVTVYNLVKKLKGLGLLVEVGGSRTSSHGVSTLYTSVIRTGSVVIKDGILEVLMVFKDGSSFTSGTKVFDENKTVSRKKKHRPLEEA